MIYFIYGLDTYRSREKLDEICRQFLAINPGGEIVNLDGGEMTFSNFAESLSSNSLFGGKKIIIVKNLLLSGDKDIKDKINDHLPKISNSDIIFIESGQPDKREKLFKRLSKEKAIFEFPYLNDFGIKNWIIKKVSDLGFKITGEAAQKLMEAVGPDLYRSESEIDKLILYITSQNLSQIEKEHIELLTSFDINPNQFELIEAIAQKKQAETIKILNQFFEKGENEQYLLSMIIYQIRTMLIVSDLVNRGYERKKIEQESGLHPFVLTKTIPLLKNYSFEKLKSMYDLIAETDFNIKIGNVEPAVALDLLVAKFIR